MTAGTTVELSASNNLLSERDASRLVMAFTCMQCIGSTARDLAPSGGFWHTPIGLFAFACGCEWIGENRLPSVPGTRSASVMCCRTSSPYVGSKTSRRRTEGGAGGMFAVVDRTTRPGVANALRWSCRRPERIEWSIGRRSALPVPACLSGRSGRTPRARLPAPAP